MIELTFLAACTVIVLAVAVVPFLYATVAFRGAYQLMWREPFLSRVVLNTGANVLVMLAALRLKGRFDRKVAGVLQRVLIVHGALAFWTLVTRSYYSIPVLLTAPICSTLLAGVVIVIRHQTAKFKVAVLGPWHPIAADMQDQCDWIQDPGADLRRYDVLLTTFTGDLSPSWAQALSRAMLAGKQVRHVAEYVEEARGVVSIEHFDLDHLPVAGLTSYRARKRLLDIALVVAAAPLALPILALGALAVLATMRRPIFFTQSRVGLGGHVFRMYKLRTMRPPQAVDVGVATIRNDTRITPLGKWLRRFRIDELPQLWNVLKGDMSIVGPRPEQRSLSDDYTRAIPAFAYRSMVRPGITGWAQVRAGYAADLAETRIKLGYDLFYLKYFSFSLDVQILLRTIWILLSGRGVR